MTVSDEIVTLIKQELPDAEVQVEDMTGTGDHFQIHVVSRAFEGKMLIEQHRIVQASIKPALEDGRIHAVHIKTETPDQKAKKNPGGDFKIIG